MKKIDYKRLAQEATKHFDSIIDRILPGGKRQGDEYLVLNPRRTDSSIGSFSINSATGRWSDFATNDAKGGDLIDLLAYVKNIKQSEAARQIAELLKMPDTGTSRTFSPSNTPQIKPGSSNEKAKASKQVWEPLVTVLPGSPEPPMSHPGLGKPAYRYAYTNELGEVFHYQYRFHLPNGDKTIRPLSLCKNILTGSIAWRWQAIPPLRPLYNLHKLVKNPTAVVIVVEGEKAADAAEKLFPDCVVTTSSHGALAAKHANWSVLRGRSIRIWPDNDAAGKKYCGEVRALATRCGATVSIININKFAHKPKGEQK